MKNHKTDRICYPLKTVKIYKTIEAETLFAGVIITKRFEAGFSQNREKGKYLTKQIEAKTIIEKQILQNKSYLENPCYKTVSLKKIKI